MAAEVRVGPVARLARRDPGNGVRCELASAGEEAMTERAFGERMGARGFEKKPRADANCYLGVGVRNDGS